VEALALVGVVLGWLLGFGQQALRDRREGQLAARLLIHELGTNAAELDARRDSLEWQPYRAVSFRAWDAYAPLILRVISVDAMFAVMTAHLAIQHADELGRLARAARERAGRVSGDSEWRAAPHQVRERLETAAAAAVADARERVDEAVRLIMLPAHEPPLRAIRRRARELLPSANDQQDGA
jgi:hypothetical protein